MIIIDYWQVVKVQLTHHHSIIGNNDRLHSIIIENLLRNIIDVSLLFSFFFFFFFSFFLFSILSPYFSAFITFITELYKSYTSKHDEHEQDKSSFDVWSMS